MTEEFNAKKLLSFYKRSLTASVLPFWLKYGMDSVHGGIYTGLDRDGSLLESDKSVWFQGRALWTFAQAYMTAASYGEDHPEYLDACRSLADFIEKHCTDKSDGRMYFRLTKDGKPVIKRLRYFFSETFAVVGFASYGRASGKKEYVQKAFNLLKKIDEIRSTPGVLIPKFDEKNAPSRGFGVPMILLNTVSELRAALRQFNMEGEDFCNRYIDDLLKEIKTYFIRPELKAVLEQCAPDGSVQYEHFEGRLLNPGHAIEGAWFIMKEGIERGDKDLQKLGIDMFDWMWERGWDKKYGGIIYFRDIENKNLSEYWQDMKFWWPQNEAVIASLYAYSLTGQKKYQTRFTLAHDYFHERFPDKKYGECYGYFHRDGTLSTPLKGNMYKGPFHIPRMYIEGIKLLERLSVKSK